MIRNLGHGGTYLNPSPPVTETPSDTRCSPLNTLDNCITPVGVTTKTLIQLLAWKERGLWSKALSSGKFAIDDRIFKIAEYPDFHWY